MTGVQLNIAWLLWVYSEKLFEANWVHVQGQDKTNWPEVNTQFIADIVDADVEEVRRFISDRRGWSYKLLV